MKKPLVHILIGTEIGGAQVAACGKRRGPSPSGQWMTSWPGCAWIAGPDKRPGCADRVSCTRCRKKYGLELK